MPEGGALGYYCQHLYAVREADYEVQASVLKGGDAAFMATGKLLGLQPEIFAVWDRNAASTEDYEETDYDDNGRPVEKAPKPPLFSKTWFTTAGMYQCVGEDVTCAQALQASHRLDHS